MQPKVLLTLKELLLLALVLLITVMVNWPIITFDLMYYEQATIFNANQTIHSVADLVHVYTHPQMLDFMVPFFRPSGHFLLYQLLAPWLGWYNTKGLIIINMIFLGLAGFMMIKLYQALFPKFKGGAYIAVSVYLINPALMISKVTIMHFEFAYVFFVLWSWYCFVKFCQSNEMGRASQPQRFQHIPLLLASVLLYIVAVTFKEPALMLAPVLACYFIIMFYRRGQVLQMVKHKEFLSILFMWATTSIALVLYLTMSWQASGNPLLRTVTLERIIVSAKQYAVYLLSLTQNYFTTAPGGELVRLAKTPASTHYLMWALLLVTAISLLNVIRQRNVIFKKSLLSLFMAMGIFMLLPLWRSFGFGWHLSLSFVCEALIIGFGVEFYLRNFVNHKIIHFVCACLALAIASTTYYIDEVNLHYLSATQAGFLARLNHNAVFNPPAIANKLNAQSILVVQDNMNLGDYQLGNSTYPALVFASKKDLNFDNMFSMDQSKIFWRIKPIYNGTLFHWAYQLPQLKEEVMAFSNDNMNLVPDDILLNWVRHLNNIVCVTYDNNANWFDNTSVFKRNVIREQKRRHLLLGQYHVLPVTALHSAVVEAKNLLYADPELCETICDNHRYCKGFTYTKISKNGRTLAQCFFYNKLATSTRSCPTCTGFIKTT